jgi:uncharacterized protein (DUF58 family)
MQKTNEPVFFAGTNTADSQNTIAKAANQFPLVIPTRQGVMYLVVNLILWLTAINYSNHNILIVALFLLSLLAVSLVMAVRVFRGVELSLGEIRPVFMGQEVRVPIHFKLKRSGDAIPLDIKMELESGESIVRSLKLQGDESGVEQLCLSPGKRGRYRLVNMQISSSFPFGLFRIRRSFTVSQTFWVYVTPWDEMKNSGVKKTRRGSERGDSVFLRQYRLGDPVRRIHKKSLAMGQNILVKDIEAQAPDSQWLQWDKTPDLATEQRLQVLTRQVLDADRQGKAYGMSLPNKKINPARGESHKHQCLRLLAEF